MLDFMVDQMEILRERGHLPSCSVWGCLVAQPNFLLKLLLAMSLSLKMAKDLAEPWVAPEFKYYWTL